MASSCGGTGQWFRQPPDCRLGSLHWGGRWAWVHGVKSLLLWPHSGGELWKKFLRGDCFVVHSPSETKRKRCSCRSGEETIDNEKSPVLCQLCNLPFFCLCLKKSKYTDLPKIFHSHSSPSPQSPQLLWSFYQNGENSTHCSWSAAKDLMIWDVAAQLHQNSNTVFWFKYPTPKSLWRCELGKVRHCVPFKSWVTVNIMVKLGSIGEISICPFMRLSLDRFVQQLQSQSEPHSGCISRFPVFLSVVHWDKIKIKMMIQVSSITWGGAWDWEKRESQKGSAEGNTLQRCASHCCERTRKRRHNAIFSLDWIHCLLSKTISFSAACLSYSLSLPPCFFVLSSPVFSSVLLFLSPHRQTPSTPTPTVTPTSLRTVPFIPYIGSHSCVLAPQAFVKLSLWGSAQKWREALNTTQAFWLGRRALAPGTSQTWEIRAVAGIWEGLFSLCDGDMGSGENTSGKKPVN